MKTMSIVDFEDMKIESHFGVNTNVDTNKFYLCVNNNPSAYDILVRVMTKLKVTKSDDYLRAMEKAKKICDPCFYVGFLLRYDGGVQVNNSGELSSSGVKNNLHVLSYLIVDNEYFLINI